MEQEKKPSHVGGVPVALIIFIAAIIGSNFLISWFGVTGPISKQIADKTITVYQKVPVQVVVTATPAPTATPSATLSPFRKTVVPAVRREVTPTTAPTVRK